MKKYIKILSILSVFIFLHNCSAQGKADSQITNNLINSEEFTFHADRAFPMNQDVVNIANSMPNAAGQRIFDLSGEGYSIEIRKNILDVALPYFGRTFNPSYGTTDNSYRFTSKDYTLTKSQSKKGNWIIKIKPNDVKNVSEIFIDISKNGKASTSIQSNDRQPITYNGYISQNEEIKKEKP
ncbi:DUF4251 domain-containing protein [Chryseobacterium echinoideorum]|uniref:DUF4251 domain-containing protein n=1 Tax=Chryseobacterium echinoideorum TaxID=1549648 RepID=UPI0011868685|nr:DUF4251 domain-containing protein [Chryseobacterium echinoideorum]